jgi:hypothetical protein
MHGGKSTGAPTGKANGNYRHGKRTKKAKRFRQTIKGLRVSIRSNDYKTTNTLMNELEALLA